MSIFPRSCRNRYSIRCSLGITGDPANSPYTQKVHLWTWRPQFLALGASSPLLTPIFGYVYVKVSNNKQSITPEASTPFKCSKKKIEGSFLGKLRGKLNIIIVLHFWYIYDILRAEVFCDAQNAPNLSIAGAMPRTPLGELTTLPQTSSQLGRGILFSISHHVDACGASPWVKGENLLQGLKGIDTPK